MNNVIAKLKDWATELKHFATSKIFLKNFGGVLGLTIGSLILILLFLRIYTRHNRYVTIPSLVGKTFEQAKALKGSNYVELQIIDTLSSYDKTLQAGEIISQDPPAESKAKKYRTVYLTVNALEREMVSFPDIWDKQENMARGQLERKNFVIKKVEKRPDRAENTVLEVRLASNDKIIKRYSDKNEVVKFKQGTAIILVVAKGRGVSTSVPSLVCKTYQEALATIRSKKLSKGAIMFSGSVSDSSSAYVWRQLPDAMDSMAVNQGDPIDLWLQAEPPAGCGFDGENDDGRLDEQDEY
jgi:beta-lactam-binding protein with PASTA domain